MHRLGTIVLFVALSFLPIALAHCRYESLLRDGMIDSTEFVELEHQLIRQMPSPRLLLELIMRGAFPIPLPLIHGGKSLKR
jgi:hypothetical protein